MFYMNYDLEGLIYGYVEVDDPIKDSQYPCSVRL